MSRAVNRKACDRCHNQKLSCKRRNDQECERCNRAQIPCTWSPSLRYRKSHQNQQQEQQQDEDTRTKPTQNLKSPTDGKQSAKTAHDELIAHIAPMSVGNHKTPDGGCRSPKRRRTGSDPEPVSPESVPIVAQTVSEEQQHLPVTATTASSVQPSPRATGLDIRDFDFGDLGRIDFFEAGHNQHQLSQADITGVEHFHQHQHQHHQSQQQPQQLHKSTPLPFFGQWDPVLQSPHSGYIDVSQAQLQAVSAVQHIDPLTYPLAQRSRAPSNISTSVSSGSGARRSRSRRARKQIALSAGPRSLSSDNVASNSNSPLHWMARLSEINARLQSLSSLLPQQYDPTGEELTEHGFPVDEMFQLTRQIADVLDGLSPLPNDGEGGLRQSGGAKLDGSDPGSSMFVLSIYVMLLDLYHKVFMLVRAEVFHLATNATFSFWKLPDVTIGSFAVDSTASLQMSLTIQLAEEFLGRLRRSTAAMDPASRQVAGNGAAGSGSVFTGVVDVSLQQVRSSEEGLRQELGVLRDRIEATLTA